MAASEPAATVTISLRLGGVSKRVVVYPGLPTDELRHSIEATFGQARDTVTAVRDPRIDKTYALTDLTSAPTFFSRSRFDLVIGGPIPSPQQLNNPSIIPAEVPMPRVAPHAIQNVVKQEQLAQIFSLTNVDVKRIMTIFQQSAPTGVLDRQTFKACFHIFFALNETRARTHKVSDQRRMKAVLNRLFDIFDRDGDGMVDSQELLSGLSVLCHGERDDKIRAAFELYDYDGDQFITQDEMQKYLSSVFAVINETSPQVFQQYGVSPNELGRITAEQCFLEADADGNGKIDFEEFKAWYSDVNAHDETGLLEGVGGKANASHGLLSAGVSADSAYNLEQFRRATGLANFAPDQVFDLFKQQGEQYGGVLDRAAFRECFDSLRRIKKLPIEPASDYMLERLFQLFDSDGNGYIDFEELASGLSVLCGGSRDDKIEAVFKLYDKDGDGFISLSEMRTFFQSVFRVLYETSPATREYMGVPADLLAEITAEQCFEEADESGDGKLSLEEFRKWYSRPSSQVGGLGAINVPGLNIPALNAAQVQVKNNTAAPQWISLSEARRLTCLDRITPSDVLDRFSAAASDSGTLSYDQFRGVCLEIVVTTGGEKHNDEDQAKMGLVLERLFHAFDSDHSGNIDFNELVAGLTVLCGGTSQEKMRNAFDLYDENKDGFISKQEMHKYLSQIMKVLFSTVPGMSTRMHGSSPEELAEITTEQCFEVADVNNDGQLSFEEFTQYMVTDDGIAMASLEMAIPNWISTAEVRRVTGLGNVPVEDVFEELAIEANEEGCLTWEAFTRVFNKVSKPATEEDKSRLKYVIERLFQLFDVDSNGLVDFAECASGLSILCAGDQIAKAESAFALYDIDGNGYVSKMELCKYLESVYKTTYSLEPGTRKRIGVSAEDLAAATTEQIFNEFDKNGDEQLDFSEFQLWFQQAGVQQSDEKQNTKQPQGTWTLAQLMQGNATGGLDGVRLLTRMGHANPEDVFEEFALEASEDGTIDLPSFHRAFLHVSTSQAGPKHTAQELAQLNAVIDRLFTLFDADSNGSIDFSEIACGLSVLCGGDEHKKAEAAFSLFDYSGDGFISLEELSRYLCCVFVVLFDLDDNVSGWVNNIGPEKLAIATAQQVFAEADLNGDGGLSFEEWKAWYSAGASLQSTPPPPPPPPGALQQPPRTPVDKYDMVEVSQLLGLDMLSPTEVFSDLAMAADEHSLLNRSAFDSVFRKVLVSRAAELSKKDIARMEGMIKVLFDIFDTDNNGLVDFQELASGLSVLCGGSRDDKVEAAFSLYDADGDGFISYSEMTSFLRSVFVVLYRCQEGVREQMEVEPEELAEITAERCFLEADLDKDGRISLEEFITWSARPTGQAVAEVVASAPDWVNLPEVRRLTGFGQISPDACFELFAEAATDDTGVLTEEAFAEVCYKVATQQRADGVVGTKADRQRFTVVLQRLFNVFDSDADNVVDFQELAAGLSVLCGGDRDAKAEAAFALYDFNDDGEISLGEMERYLSAVFSLMYAMQPETQRNIGVDAKQLAKQTAVEIFQEADKTNRGRLNFAEFKAWYEKPNAQPVNNIVKTAPTAMSLIDIVRMSGLEHFPPAYAFEQFAVVANEDGVLDRAAFFHVFNKLAAQTRSLRSKEDSDRLRVVLSRLFDVFDTDQNGTIDFAELASGVSVLCGGNMESKAEACFSLFDFNGDGVIEFNEMVRYLKSVYLTVYLLKPDIDAANKGMDADTLAKKRATQIFSSAELTNGRLGYPAFRAWFTSSSRKDAIPTLQSLLEGSAAPLAPHHGSFALARRGPREMVPAGDNNSMSSAVSAVSLETMDLASVKEITGLNKLNSEECFEELAHAVNDQGKLEKAAFVAVMSRISGRNQMDPKNRQVFHAVVDALFRAFVSGDEDGDGQADFAELASGISVLCGGSSDDKAEAAFSLYDIDGDHFIVPSEMIKYLGSVYKLVYQFQPGVGMKQSNMSPEQLAFVTTQQIFLDADTDSDGRLSFDEFQRWYCSPTGQVSTDDDSTDDEDVEEDNVGTGSWVSLADVKRLTGMDKLSMEDCIEVFAEQTEDGVLTRDSFAKAFVIIAEPKGLSSEDRNRLKQVMVRLFDAFDSNKDGEVDLNELSSGLAVLCDGEAEEKVEVIFALFDTNGDGFISLDELQNALQSCFKVLMETSPEAYAHDVGVASPAQLAVATAEQCFLEADLNGDGRIGLDEFMLWMGSEGDLAQGIQASADLSTKKPARDGNAVGTGSLGSIDRRQMPLVGEAPVANLAEIRRLTKLEEYDVQDVLDFIKASALHPSTNSSQNGLTFNAFTGVLEQLLANAGGWPVGSTDEASAQQVIERLFVIFDSDQNGIIDHKELASGLSVLCAGSKEDKVRAAFTLYDMNSDGFISLDEMTHYLTSVFKVLLAANPAAARKMGVSPEQLGQITAEQCFTEADLDADGRLSMEEFSGWYTKAAIH